MLPMDRIVLETDAPYLAPTPHRGSRNDSSMINLVVDKMAEIKELSREEIIKSTTKSAMDVYPRLKEIL